MIDAFHDEVDTLAAKLEREHRGRLQCKRGCSACCVDEITVFEVEAAKIRDRHGSLLASATPHPVGMCAFLDTEGACRVYDARPYVCRTQGLPIRWIEEPSASDGPLVERRDICELNDAGPLITDLTREQCWTIGPAEAKLRAMQAEHGEPMARVRLRDLFDCVRRNMEPDVPEGRLS
jgi:hypothetical protein